jgi:hypothetical protein
LTNFWPRPSNKLITIISHFCSSHVIPYMVRVGNFEFLIWLLKN